MNSRPPCSVAEEMEQIITLSHFLIRKRHVNVSELKIEESHFCANIEDLVVCIDDFCENEV